MKILMVCLGNICRSPLAEGILRKKIQQSNLPWEVDSAGTGNYHIDESPDHRSIYIASVHGIDIATLKGRQFHYTDFEKFDLIYAMDRSNYNDIIKQSQSQQERDKVKLILNEVNPGKNQSVPDPYWDDDGFEKVYTMLDLACDLIIQNLSDSK